MVRISKLAGIVGWLTLFAWSVPAIAAPKSLSFTSDRMGNVTVIVPKGKATDIVIMFSDSPDATSARQVVQKLNALGAAVAVIDSQAYIRALAATPETGDDCLWLSSEVEELNRQIQRKLGFPAFRVPILLSSGQGGNLVYALLAEAPSYSFGGGISVDFLPTVDARLNLCGVGKPAEPGGFIPNVELALPWLVEADKAQRGAVADWVNEIDKAELVQPEPHVASADHIAAMIKPMLDAAVSRDPNSLEDLPIIEMPVASPAPYIAIVYSGDGGWRDLDRSLGEVLQASGVPVVGVDSLLYFWQPKRPEVVAQDLNRIVDHYRQAWHIDHVVLIGYSFGADILPFAYNRMAEEPKSSIVQISLLALSRNTRFEISVSEYLSDTSNDQTRLVGPELTHMPPGLVQCFYGELETTDSACTTPEAAKMELIETAGGHHFGDEYDDLVKKIIAGATKRVSALK